MKYFRIFLLSIILTACASVPQEGNFSASGHYRQNGDGSYDLSHVQITLIPVGITPTPSATPAPPSPTAVVPTVTGVPSATPTAVPPTATTTPSLTATPIVGMNLFKDPGFEGPYTERVNSDGFIHNIPINWNPFYCDECPAFRQGTGNPTGLKLGRPEYKPAAVDQDPLRIHSGINAGEFFGFYRAIDGGYYQTVTTPAGSICEVTIYVQSWSSVDGDRDPHASHLITTDDKSNSTWYIRVDLGGGTNAFAGGVLKSRGFGYNDGIYDRYAKISYSFTTTGTKTTIFIEDTRQWPVRNNNSYVDDAILVCSGGVQPTATHVPSTAIPTISDSLPANVEYTVLVPVLNVRTSRDYSISTNITRTMIQGTKVIVHCVVEFPEETFWGSSSSCSSNSEWFILRLNGVDYAKSPQGIEGY